MITQNEISSYITEIRSGPAATIFRIYLMYEKPNPYPEDGESHTYRITPGMITWETSAKAFNDKYPKDMIPKTIQIAPILPFEKIVRTSKGEPFEKFMLLTHTIESVATLIENTIDVIPKAILCLDTPTFYSECWNFLEEYYPDETKKGRCLSFTRLDFL